VLGKRALLMAVLANLLMHAWLERPILAAAERTQEQHCRTEQEVAALRLV
jgi:hypothetical protein